MMWLVQIYFSKATVVCDDRIATARSWRHFAKSQVWILIFLIDLINGCFVLNNCCCLLAAICERFRNFVAQRMYIYRWIKKKTFDIDRFSFSNFFLKKGSFALRRCSIVEVQSCLRYRTRSGFFRHLSYIIAFTITTICSFHRAKDWCVVRFGLRVVLQRSRIALCRCNARR